MQAAYLLVGTVGYWSKVSANQAEVTWRKTMKVCVSEAAMSSQCQMESFLPPCWRAVDQVSIWQQITVQQPCSKGTRMAAPPQTNRKGRNASRPAGDNGRLMWQAADVRHLVLWNRTPFSMETSTAAVNVESAKDHPLLPRRAIGRRPSCCSACKTTAGRVPLPLCC